MSRSGEQTTRNEEKEEEKVRHEGLPLESSPYLKYKDLEDYKRQGYGTQGHLSPKHGRGAGATDAPTLAGTGLSPKQASIIDAAHHHGIP